VHPVTFKAHNLEIGSSRRSLKAGILTETVALFKCASLAGPRRSCWSTPRIRPHPQDQRDWLNGPPKHRLGIRPSHLVENGALAPPAGRMRAEGLDSHRGQFGSARQQQRRNPNRRPPVCKFGA